MSIRRKLLVALLSALAFVGVAAASLTWLAVRREANDMFDYHLQQMALSLRDQTLQRQAVIVSQLDHDFIVQIWDPLGGLAYLSSRDILLPRESDGFHTIAVDGEPWRIYAYSQIDKTIQVAAPVNLQDMRGSAMALRILVPIAVSIPLFALLIWWLVGYELRPLRQIAAAIRRRAPSSLEPLAETSMPDEVRPLVSELNALLGRLREAIEAQKRFTADAAHELRSPLTALQLQVQLVERAASPEEAREALAALREGARRASRLVGQMLTMARLEPEAAQEAPAEVDLAALAANILPEFEPLAEAKRVELRLGRLEPARVSGQQRALETLLRNLVDNALRYTPPGGRVAVETREENGAAVLEVRDTGPGIPRDERSRVFDRFHRVPGAGADGSGLGLAIVKRIADAHRAQVHLDESEGGGLRATVRFDPR